MEYHLSDEERAAIRNYNITNDVDDEIRHKVENMVGCVMDEYEPRLMLGMIQSVYDGTKKEIVDHVMHNMRHISKTDFERVAKSQNRKPGDVAVAYFRTIIRQKLMNIVWGKDIKDAIE